MNKTEVELKVAVRGLLARVEKLECEIRDLKEKKPMVIKVV